MTYLQISTLRLRLYALLPQQVAFHITLYFLYCLLGTVPQALLALCERDVVRRLEARGP